MAGAAGSRTAGAVTPEELRLEKWTEERAQVRRMRNRGRVELRGARADRSETCVADRIERGSERADDRDAALR